MTNRLEVKHTPQRVAIFRALQLGDLLQAFLRLAL